MQRECRQRENEDEDGKRHDGDSLEHREAQRTYAGQEEKAEESTKGNAEHAAPVGYVEEVQSQRK